MATITYEDKVDINVDEAIPEINKVVDDNMNEIKNVVNTNFNLFEQRYTIIESDNATAIKYENGILITFGTVTFSNINMVTFSTNLYRTVSQGFDDFPIEYSEIPVVTYTPYSISTSSGLIVNGVLLNYQTAPTTTNPGKFCIVLGSNVTISGTCKYFAIGKWK